MARHAPVTILLSAAAMVLLAAALALLSPETALVGVASLVCIQALLMTRSAYALLPLLAIAVAYHAFSSVPLGVGSIAVYPTDVALVGALLLWLVFYSLRGQPLFIPKGHQYVLLLCVVLVEPIAIGLIQGAALQSVLAPARVLAYYASFLVFVSLIKDRRGASNVLVMVLALSSVAALYLVYTRASGIVWVNGMSEVQLSAGNVSRGYGWWSATPWYPAGCLIALSFAWLSKATLKTRVAAALIALALMIATLSTLIRGDTIALAVGIAVVSIYALRAANLSQAAQITRHAGNRRDPCVRFCLSS